MHSSDASIHQDVFGNASPAAGVTPVTLIANLVKNLSHSAGVKLAHLDPVLQVRDLAPDFRQGNLCIAHFLLMLLNVLVELAESSDLGKV